MAKLPSLEKINADLKDVSDKIDALKHHIHGLEENIALLTSLERQFKQNLYTLKDHTIIAMASEFKKIKQDLTTVSGRIDTACIDLKNSKVYLGRSEKLLIELKDRHDIVTESPKGKLLTGKFGNK